MAALTVTADGVYLGQEHKSGESVRDGVKQPYEYDQAHILLGTEVVHARIEDDFVGEWPKAVGLPIRAVLRISAYKSGQSAELSARLVRTLPVAS